MYYIVNKDGSLSLNVHNGVKKVMLNLNSPSVFFFITGAIWKGWVE